MKQKAARMRQAAERLERAEDYEDAARQLHSEAWALITGEAFPETEEPKYDPRRNREEPAETEREPVPGETEAGLLQQMLIDNHNLQRKAAAKILRRAHAEYTESVYDEETDPVAIKMREAYALIAGECL